MAICITIAATLTTGGFLLTIPLILGVTAETLAPRRGRWLMWVGAAYVSVTLLPMQVLILPEFIAELHSYHRLGGLGPIIFPLSVLSCLLLVWCDLELATDAIRAKGDQLCIDRHPPGVGDWIVWISALLFSVYSLAGIPSLVRVYNNGLKNADLILPGLAIILIASLFDIALLIDAIKMRHINRMRTTA